MKPSDLDTATWKKIDAIFDEALDVAPDERPSFVETACEGDEAVKAQVLALLEAHARAESSLEAPRELVDEALDALVPPVVEGRRVGPFRLVREIGRGGMGVVYLAEDPRLDRLVALKALPRFPGVGDRGRARFLAEARAVATLDHPNIATLFEADTTDQGQLYMAFAYYEGETLDERIRRGPLSPEEATWIAARIAAGLDAAHARGIIHRDVKPSNVLLTDSGEVKLLDFGVAKVAGEDITAEGLSPGTIAYMSPEQTGDGPVDERTDLWALGVVLYEMLAGERPFRSSGPAPLIQAIQRAEPVPIGSLRDDLSDGLERVVAGLLERSADRRFQSAADVLSVLRHLPEADASERIGDAPTTWNRVPKSRRGGSGSARWPRAAAAAALIALLAAGGWWWSGARASDDRIGQVAVLPLVDLSAEDDRRYLVDGVHEALIGELGKLGTIDVLSRTSVARFRDTEAPLPEIARALDVDGLIEGSVSIRGDSLSITARLVQASPERLLWTGSFQRSLGEVYGVTGEVARSVAQTLGIGPNPAAGGSADTGGPVDARAYDAYALGLFHTERRDREGLSQARRYFNEAIARDSTFAAAYAGLAEALGSAAFFGLLEPSSTMPRVEALARTALHHDSMLPLAHQVLGSVLLYGAWDREGAERHLRRAIELNPSLGGPYRMLSEILATRGRYEEALDAVERGAELGRMVPFSTFQPVAVLIYMREYERAIQRTEAGLDLFPDFWQGHWLLCEAYAGIGRYERALTACEGAVRLSDRASAPLGTLGYVYARSGRTEDALAVLAELEARAARGYVGATDIAIVHLALGDRDQAYVWLDRAYEERDVALVHLNDHAWFDPLRSDARFQSLVQRVGLDREAAGSDS